MAEFICLVDKCFFNHNLYERGDVVNVEDKDLIVKMEGRFQLKSDFDKGVAQVLSKIEDKKQTFTKDEVIDVVKEVKSENARLQKQLKELKTKPNEKTEEKE